MAIFPFYFIFCPARFAGDPTRGEPPSFLLQNIARDLLRLLWSPAVSKPEPSTRKLMNSQFIAFGLENAIQSTKEILLSQKVCLTRQTFHCFIEGEQLQDSWPGHLSAHSATAFFSGGTLSPIVPNKWPYEADKHWDCPKWVIWATLYVRLLSPNLFTILLNHVSVSLPANGTEFSASLQPYLDFSPQHETELQAAPEMVGGSHLEDHWVLLLAMTPWLPQPASSPPHLCSQSYHIDQPANTY